MLAVAFAFHAMARRWGERERLLSYKNSGAEGIRGWSECQRQPIGNSDMLQRARPPLGDTKQLVTHSQGFHDNARKKHV